MGRMKCRCGHVMSDVLLPCPTTGVVVGDVFEEAAFREWSRAVSTFLSSLRAGRRTDWLKDNPRFAEYVEDEDIVGDLLDDFRVGCTPAWECESCGRLWLLTRPDENGWQSFRPEPSADSRA